ncbi:hypothetical protein D3C86_1197890 [compost metagenome]
MMNRRLRATLIACLAAVPALAGCDIKTIVSNSTGTAGSDGGNNNRPPTITAYTANPTNTTSPGQAITFSIDAVDPDNDILKYTWTATGGTLSTNTGRVVNWTPPVSAGTFIVQVALSDQKGGTAEGSQNLVVKADGTAQVGAQ